MPDQIERRQMNRVVEQDLQPDIESGTSKLHAMGFTDLLDTTFSLYRAHLWSFLGISTLYFLAMLIGVSISFFDDWIGKSTRTTIWVFTIGAILCVSVFVVSALISASAQAYLDGKISTWTALKQGGRQFFRCCVGLLIYGLLTVILTFLSLLPLGGMLSVFRQNEFLATVFGLAILSVMVCAVVCFVTYWCFLAATVLVENKSIRDGFERRPELLSRTWCRVIGTMCAIFLLHFGISFIFRVAFGILLTVAGLADIQEFFETVQWLAFFQLPGNLTEFHLLNVLMHLINLGIDAFTMPIWVIGCTLLYFDQRIRKEGFDIEVMATRQGE